MSPVMEVHPAFDTTDRVWFTEKGVTAETLAELQRKLPKAKIIGYYPNGYNGSVKVVTPPSPSVRTPSYAQPATRQPQARYRPAQASLFPEPELPDEPLKELPPVPFTAKTAGTAELPGVAPKFSKAVQQGAGVAVDEPLPPKPANGAPHSQEPVNEAPVRSDPPPPPVLQEVQKAEPAKQCEVGGAVQGEAGPAPRATPGVDDPDETEGRKLYRAQADALASAQTAKKRTVRLTREGSAVRPFSPPKPAPEPKRSYSARTSSDVTPWTTKDIKDLKRMVLVEKLSDAAIAKKTGRTRNSIIGRRHRSGLFAPKR